MQLLLQWLCNDAHEKEGQRTSHSIKKKDIIKDKGSVKSVDIVVSDNCGGFKGSKRLEGSKIDIKKLKSFLFLCRRDIAKSCFYSTINLNRPRTQGIDKMQQYWIQNMKKEDIAMGMRGICQKPDSSSHTAGTKVLPITDASFAEQCRVKTDKKDLPKGNSKTKSKSRMKELLRWTMSTKSEKGGKFMSSSKVLHTSNGKSREANPNDDDRANIDSPKISFRWEVESCSTVSSSYSTVSSLKDCSIKLKSTSIQDINCCHPRKGSWNWITTDSEFVVLEL